MAQQDPQILRLVDEINRLHKQFANLQRQINQRGGGAQFGAATPGSVVNADTADRRARMEVRLGQVEDQMRTLTGDVETVAHDIRKLAVRIDRLIADVDMRLRPIEGTQRGAAEQPVAAAAGQPTTPFAPGPAPAPSAARPPSQESTLSALLFPTGPVDVEPPATAAPALEATTETPEPEVSGRVLPRGTPVQQYAYAFGLLRQANYDEAEQALRAFIETYPDGELTGNAYYWLAETFYVRNDLEQAVVYFARGYQDFSDSIKAPDNLLKLGMALTRLGRNDDACVTFEKLGELFPGVSPIIKARAQSESQRAGCG
ncbi:MAG: tol-pal system protein YbgF [Proteobacteria bacterium]|nr:tol-pal system protein YbgF [Pseudomonadota bacterium]